MRAIKNYRVRLLESENPIEFSNIFEVNQYITTDILKRNSQPMGQIETYNETGFIFVTPESYLIESYNWDKLEFQVSHVGLIKNKTLD